MIKVNNRVIIKKLNPILFNRLLNLENQNPVNVIKENSKTGQPILKVKQDDTYIYINSKYDPNREAKIFIEQIKLTGQTNHVLFVGTGLGYHIRYFLEEYKEVDFSIFEPNIDILFNFLSEVSLEKFNENRLKNIFTDINQVSNVESIKKLISNNSKTIILPITEKLNKNEVQNTLQVILDAVKHKHSQVNTNATFQKRWIINSLKNFPKVLTTPNMLMDINKKYFKGKPVILVAAGPSLSLEIEHLKYIKKHGLAYIFSVGSSINTLIEHGIIPDAACTFDPSDKNQLVFRKLKEKNMKNIPLIFGSSVGFETLENFSGPMLHMITSQDTVASSLLDTSQDIDIVLDAPSIAIITLQLLVMLEVSQIILVGQNFCFYNNERYAKGISYEFIKNELSQNERDNVILVESVNGMKVPSSNSYLNMKKNFEYFINKSPSITIINTTQHGAKIEGTQFKLLENVIIDNLKEKNIIINDWFKTNIGYNHSFTTKKVNELKKNFNSIHLDINKCLSTLNKINQALETNGLKNIENLYGEFDKEFSLIKKNMFYEVILEPMIRVQNQILSEKSSDIKFERNPRKKAKLVVDSFTYFLKVIYINFEFVKPFFNDFLLDLKEKGV